MTQKYRWDIAEIYNRLSIHPKLRAMVARYLGMKTDADKAIDLLERFHRNVTNCTLHPRRVGRLGFLSGMAWNDLQREIGVKGMLALGYYVDEPFFIESRYQARLESFYALMWTAFGEVFPDITIWLDWAWTKNKGEEASCLSEWIDAHADDLIRAIDKHVKREKDHRKKWNRLTICDKF